MKIEKTHHGVRIGNDWIGVSFHYFNPIYQFTPIEWTLEKEAGWFTTSFTICNIQIVFEFLVDRLSQKKWEAKLEKAKKEMDDGDYYFFVHNKNPLLKEFAEYMEKYPGLRFWQALFSWSGAKTIEVNGEDPFHWEEKIVDRNLSKKVDDIVYGEEKK